MAKTRGQAARGNNEKPFKKLTSIVLLLFDTILDFMLLFQKETKILQHYVICS